MSNERDSELLASLTPRQTQVLELISRGYTNPKIAEELGVSLDGAKWHVREIITKLNVTSREEAAFVWRNHHRPTRRLHRALIALAPQLNWHVSAAVAAVAVAVPVAIICAFAIWPSHGDGSHSSTNTVPIQTPALESPFYPVGLETGIPVIDEVLRAIEARDRTALVQLLDPFPVACSKISALGAAMCPPGTSGGTPIEVIGWAGAEGIFAAPDSTATAEMIDNLLARIDPRVSWIARRSLFGDQSDVPGSFIIAFASDHFLAVSDTGVTYVLFLPAGLSQIDSPDYLLPPL